jgi:hypothetical protein
LTIRARPVFARQRRDPGNSWHTQYAQRSEQESESVTQCSHLELTAHLSTLKHGGSPAILERQPDSSPRPMHRASIRTRDSPCNYTSVPTLFHGHYTLGVRHGASSPAGAYSLCDSACPRGPLLASASCLSGKRARTQILGRILYNGRADDIAIQSPLRHTLSVPGHGEPQVPQVNNIRMMQ